MTRVNLKPPGIVKPPAPPAPPARGDNFELVDLVQFTPVGEITDERWLERFVLKFRELLDPDVEADFVSADSLLDEYDEYKQYRAIRHVFVPRRS